MECDSKNKIFVNNNSCPEDDEIFFGKFSLTEAKKHIFLDRQRQTIACLEVNSLQEDLEKSLKIIETTSEPDLCAAESNSFPHELRSPLSSSCLTPSECDLYSRWDNVSDESFLMVEKMVDMLSVSSNIQTNVDIHNIEVVEQSLNMKDIENAKNCADNPSVAVIKQEKCDVNETKGINSLESTSATSLAYFTPAKVEPDCSSHQEVFATPTISSKKTLFKTPALPISNKKVMPSTKKTPSKIAFQHISSPIASYIRKGPQVPLIKDVRPKKPLPGCTSIPKLKKNPMTKSSYNKENMKLPCVAYKSAKKTKVIDLPDESVMPSSQWAKKVISSLPRPKVLKHDHREVDFSREPLKPQQEDSFAELSCHQADVSVCTQKSAFIRPKKM